MREHQPNLSKDDSKTNNRDASDDNKHIQHAEFIDKRPEAHTQHRLQQLMNHGSHAIAQRKALSQIFGNTAQTKKPMNNAGENQSSVQKKENDTGLPDHLKAGIENLSGLAMDDVKVHYNSDKPAQLNAHAYAQGTDIHLSSGQEKHLPHEAWHVVQQKQGRVKPTIQMREKVNINDDHGIIQAVFEDIFEQKDQTFLDKAGGFSEADGRDVMAKLAAGDVSAINGLTLKGKEMEMEELIEKIEARSVEFGLTKKQEEDRVAIFVGEEKSTSWETVDKVEEAESVAHSHPFRKIEEETSLNDLFGSGKESLILPSMSDFWMAYEEERDHTVYTPYELQEDKIVDPGETGTVANLLRFKIDSPEKTDRLYPETEFPIIKFTLTAHKGASNENASSWEVYVVMPNLIVRELWASMVPLSETKYRSLSEEKKEEVSTGGDLDSLLGLLGVEDESTEEKKEEVSTGGDLDSLLGLLGVEDESTEEKKEEVSTGEDLDSLLKALSNTSKKPPGGNISN